MAERALTKQELDAIVEGVKQRLKAGAAADSDREKRLMEKLKQIERKKLEQSLKCFDRLAKVKSVGNGL